jgi:glyoxylase-like metal-dependent hydrolase (beta-lactamase superfamily II)
MRQLFDPETFTFTYLLADPRTGDAALLDTVLGHEDRDLLLLQELKLTLRFCLETHLHADHITSACQLRRRTGCSLVVPAAPGIRNADRLLYGGEVLTLGTLSVEVIATPGHTPEHVAYRIGDHTLFTGDCLLIRGCGRTDFQNGNASDLYDSLRKLLSMPDSMVVYPGHDSKGRTSTTIVEEREFNPRIAGRSRESFIQLMTNLKLAPAKLISTALPANQYLGDFLPDGERKWERALDQEKQVAHTIEATNKDIINEYLGMFI